MEPRDEILSVMEALKIADTKTIGEIMSARGKWKAGNSSTVNSHKALVALAELGKLERGKGFFRVGTQSEWKEHSKLLTKYLAKILAEYPETIVYREHFIQEVGLRPDAICLIRNGQKAACIILEVMLNETDEYLTQKINTWNQWQGATEYLSKLFGYKIPSYQIRTVRE